MTRTQRFGWSVEVSLEFLAQEPALAQQWLDSRHDQIGKVEYMTGPRGGNYRLVTPPDDWRSNIDPFWHPKTARYVTKRWGRYVRPDRVRPLHRSLTFGTFTVPVKKGRAMLPDGRTVETQSRFVEVPVPPATIE